MKFHNWRNGVANHKRAVKKNANALRAGALSAAAINWTAFFDPVESHPDIVLSAVATRSLTKAQAQIDKYQLQGAKAYGSYEEMLADPDIDVVYSGLPNVLHAQWVIKAMEAGKHILIEKPITGTASDLEKIRACAEKTGKVALEAMHWKFHPAAHLVKEKIDSGDYGPVQSVSSVMVLPDGTLSADDVRLNFGLAGGATMDLIYVLSTACHFSGLQRDTEVQVQKATPRLNANAPQIDEAMDAELVLKTPGKPDIRCITHGDLAQPKLLGIVPKYWNLAPSCTVELEKARIHFDNFVGPHMNHSITVAAKDAKGNLTGKKETFTQYKGGPKWGDRGEKWWTSYRYQLEAFVDMVRERQRGEVDENGPGTWHSLEASQDIMAVIDAVYDKAGLERRRSTGLL